MFQHWHRIVWILVIALSVSPLLAQTPPPATGVPVATQADSFVVPETGTAQEYFDCLNRIAQVQPATSITSRKELLAFLDKQMTASAIAATRLLAAQPTEAQATLAIERIFGASNFVHSTKTPDEIAAFDDTYVTPLFDQITAFGYPELLRKARRFRLQISSQLVFPQTSPWTAEEQAAVQANFQKALEQSLAFVGESSTPSLEDAQMLQQLCRRAESGFVFREGATDMDFAYVAAVATQVAELLKPSQDPGIQKIAQQCEGTGRRLGANGKPFVLNGILLDGSTLDWSAYRGKVVLVDFWATWCGPCINEAKNIHKAYDMYHAKGFEVIGVSVDSDRAALEKYLAKANYPWTIIWDPALNQPKTPTEETPQEDRSMHSYYGIYGIPTVFLIDQKGKVITQLCRGEKLFEQLQKLLGDPQ